MSEPYVVFRADPRALAALPVRYVLETMRPLAVEPLAGAPAFVKGAAIVRARPVPVIDAAALFSGDTTHATRWISFAVADRAAILAVHSILGVRPLERQSAAAPVFAHAARGAIDELAALDGELFAVLSAARLVDDDTWRALDEAAHAR